MMIYNVKPGQNLAEVCDEIHLENPDYLRDFHNKSCPLTEYIEGDIINTARLSIPTAQQIKEINKKIRENHESFYEFPFNGQFPFAFDLWDGIYHITRTEYLNEEIINNYEQKIQLNFEFAKDNCFYFQFNAFGFKKNAEVSDNKISTLAKMCMKVIYPIRLVITSNGKIQNIELTKEPFQIFAELDSIKNFFPDQHSSDYIEKMKDYVKNPKTISEKLKNTLLNTFMFGTFYKTKFENWTSSNVYHDFYPWIFDAQPIRFEFQNTLLSKESLNDEWIRIWQKGISYDNRSLEDLHLKDSEYDKTKITETSIDCEHFAEYIFSREKYSLHKIEARFQCFSNENTEKVNFSLERTTDKY
ncbi:hypothetical protein BAS06_06725 [Elizabethkingia miricola]|uniref:hypothetical protein n=1 Tax=Weeksellaceae TaxID=2762318 RepID=UPI00099B0DCA|nr:MULTISPECIES: hypothetical protein [Weeksellaceae]MDV3492907.1 hypothetical protein [Elizabethkingia anophelis]MDV4129620.1 hypothetical protein [Elizabethkingia anophelis]OPB90028.1 hypothetical protein BAS06_06725 [Elizabethkingia miricola]UEQ76291.1 hypothetical protein J8N07_22195 [Chryseobacterium arthrosphaerae]